MRAHKHLSSHRNRHTARRPPQAGFWPANDWFFWTYGFLTAFVSGAVTVMGHPVRSVRRTRTPGS